MLITSLCLWKDPQHFNTNASCLCISSQGCVWAPCSQAISRQCKLNQHAGVLYLAGILPNRNSVDALQLSHFHNFKNDSSRRQTRVFQGSLFRHRLQWSQPNCSRLGHNCTVVRQLLHFPNVFPLRSASTRIFFRFLYSPSFLEVWHFGFNVQLTFIWALIVFLKWSHFHVHACDEIPLFEVYFCYNHVHTSKRNPGTQK